MNLGNRKQNRKMIWQLMLGRDLKVSYEQAVYNFDSWVPIVKKEKRG